MCDYQAVQAVISALTLGLDFIGRSEQLARANADHISFMVSKIDMGKVAEYRQSIQYVRIQDDEVMNALKYIEAVYADLEQSVLEHSNANVTDNVTANVSYGNVDIISPPLRKWFQSLGRGAKETPREEAPISFCLSNQPTDLGAFSEDMAVYQHKISALLRVFH